MSYGGVWELSDLNGTPTVTGVNGEAGHHGVARLTLPGGTTASGALATPTAVLGDLPVGLVWAATLRINGALTSTTWWSGLASDVDDVAVVDFVGVRYAAAGDAVHIEGVCRSGGAETTVDLATAAADEWFTLGLFVTGAGVEFAVFTLDERGIWDVERKAAIDTHVPAGPFFWIALAGISSSGADRSADVDAWGVGGRVAR